MILLNIFSKIRSCKQLFYFILGSSFPLLCLLACICSSEGIFLSFTGKAGLLWSLSGMFSLAGFFIIDRKCGTLLLVGRHLLLGRNYCIIEIQWVPHMITDRHLLLGRHFCIIDRKWVPFLITIRNMITIGNILTNRHMLNSINLLQSSNYVVVELIFSLCRVILVPLNLIIDFCIITLGFVSVCDFLCFCPYLIP